MKKILIVSHGMGLGGIERSLLGLLNSFDYNNYEVDLFLMKHEGELLSEIPEKVKLLPAIPACTCYAVPIQKAAKNMHFLMCFGRAIAKFKAKYFIKKNNRTKAYSSIELEYSHKYTMPFIPKLRQEGKIYDLAISFATPHYFVSKKVTAKKKAAWIHTDYSTIDIDEESEFKMWNAYDYIVGVSENCVNSFLNVFPELAYKTIVIENILMSEMVKKNASEKKDAQDEFDHAYTNLLSVGRFDKAKNFEAIPEIVARLLKRGLKIKWYLIGYGDTEAEIIRNIDTFHVQESVILLGKKENPYPYMKDCDVYVQPSKFEGKCVAVREAQILCKPVIITRYLTAESQIDSGINGYIIEQGIDNIVDGLFDLLSNFNLLTKVAENCSKIDFGNQSEIKKIYNMIED